MATTTELPLAKRLDALLGHKIGRVYRDAAQLPDLGNPGLGGVLLCALPPEFYPTLGRLDEGWECRMFIDGTGFLEWQGVTTAEACAKALFFVEEY